MGYLLILPLRRLYENPTRILGPFVEPGMTVLDVGCAMGFFSLPLARLTGENGRVVCVDLQPRMIRTLERRAKRAGLVDRIESRVCTETSLTVEDMTGEIDFACVFHVVHEVPDASVLMAELYEVLRTGARMLVAEPAGHISVAEFAVTVALAEGAGFEIEARPVLKRSHAVLLCKPSNPG